MCPRQSKVLANATQRPTTQQNPCITLDVQVTVPTGKFQTPKIGFGDENTEVLKCKTPVDVAGISVEY